MIRVNARYDGRTLTLKNAVDLPVGWEGEVQIDVQPPGAASEGVAGRHPLVALVEELDQMPDEPDAPTDFAMNVDHYVYGARKRSQP